MGNTQRKLKSFEKIKNWFRKKKIGFNIYTEIETWFRFRTTKPGFGCTLLVCIRKVRWYDNDPYNFEHLDQSI